MQKITGIGGIFIKCSDPKTLAEWYQQNLGIPFGSKSYVEFGSEKKDNHAAPQHTVLSFFKEGDKYFDPSKKQLMINLRVSNLDALLAELRAKKVWVDEKVEKYEYGKFGWIMDPEGNKIELWEPAGD